MQTDTHQLMCLPGQSMFEVQNVATSGNTYPQDWFFEWAAGGNRSDSGVSVNGYTALCHCPLWQGINIIAGDVGQVPIRLVRNEFDEQKRHPAWSLLRLRPNELQTPSVWRETMMQWAIIWGNGLSWIVRDRGVPVDLIPLRPDCVWPYLVQFEGIQVVVYKYFSPTLYREFTFLQDDVIHIQGLTSDGVWGYPLYEVAKNCIGEGLAINKHASRTFRNAARTSGVLKTAKRMSPEAMKNLRESFERIQSGPDNAGRVVILEEGMEFMPVSMTMVDAQWAEAKEMSGIDAARLLNLPAYKLNYLKDSSVRANLEEQNADYVQRTLSRWFNRWDEELRRKILTRAQWLSDEYKFVHDVGQFLQADIDTLSQVVDRLIKAEVMNRNEGRRKFGMPPYEGGEKFGSPAINPQPRDGENGNEGPAERDSDDDEGERERMRMAAHRDLVLDRVAHLVDCESNRLRHAAKSCRNFVGWLDEYYGRGGGESQFLMHANKIMEKTIAAAVSVGLPADRLPKAIITYANSRHEVILEACSHVTKTDLPGAIDTFTAGDPFAVACDIVATLEARDDEAPHYERSNGQANRLAVWNHR